MKLSDEMLLGVVRVDKLTRIFSELMEDFNGYERRVVLAYLQDVTRHSRERLPMGLLEQLGIESQGARQSASWAASKSAVEN